MGAFLLVSKKYLQDRNFGNKLHSVTEIFTQKKKLNISVEKDLGEYRLYLFEKKFYEAKNYMNLQNGDFIAATGSLYYKGSFGENGLLSLYDDFISGVKIENHCKGHYCVILKGRTGILIFSDYFGIYPVYYNSGFTMISSSFIAVATLLPQLTISKNELYEYLLNGYWYGDQTLFSEIKMLSGGGILNIETGEKKFFEPDYRPVKNCKYEEMVVKIHSTLKDHFSLLTKAFGNVRTGLSGGYDTRMMLAFLLKLKVNPSLYVNGTPGSADISCAKAISEGLGLPLEEIRFYEEFERASDDPESFFMNRFYLFDGLGTSGVFDNYSDLEYSLLHPSVNSVLLNGAGGEIYREAWNIPDHRISLDSFVKARYDKYNVDDILSGYSGQEYLENIKYKLIRSGGFKSSVISRDEIELLHPGRYKAIHFIMSAYQQLYPFVMPFYEPDLIFQSFEIPVKYKYRGRLNKDLLLKTDPVIASFKSAYGYSFSQPVPPGFKLREYIRTNFPLNLRPYFRRYKKNRKLPVTKYAVDLLDDKIMVKLLPGNHRFIDQFINIDEVNNKSILSRALTIELLLRQPEIKQCKF